ncbi:MAG: hypothetical protein WKF77_21890 [Planctomycetaceae bacterium]
MDLLDAGNGQVLINWITKDAAVVPQTLMIEFADGTDGRWKPVPLTAAASGQASIQALAGSVVSVRSAVQDAAGNQGEASGSTGVACGRTDSECGSGNQSSPSVAKPLGPSPFPGLKPVADSSMLGSGSLTLPSTSSPLSVADGVPPAATAGFSQIQSGQASSAFVQPQPTNAIIPSVSSGLPASTPMKEASYQSAAGTGL